MILWATGAFASSIAHLVAPEFMASGTAWPLANGWQREIAFFDMFLALFILNELRTRAIDSLYNLIFATGALSVFLGVNHLVSAMGGHWGYIHIAGCIANAAAVIVSLSLVLRKLCK
ncbi:hypothetical protein HX882_12580 [Pseudomonas gingeri]|uniref:Uncharacterized protein n=1 Tax=Pseudomonas gingeri TaxID=117681 RepID=A0A7Y7XBL5_9PSED|nr:hypothetical protein [Pseudomonas gingeri]NWB96731.1 hypothetical protein [Pseudomonas gingeri]